MRLQYLTGYMCWSKVLLFLLLIALQSNQFTLTFMHQLASFAIIDQV